MCIFEPISYLHTFFVLSGPETTQLCIFFFFNVDDIQLEIQEPSQVATSL